MPVLRLKSTVQAPAISRICLHSKNLLRLKQTKRQMLYAIALGNLTDNSDRDMYRRAPVQYTLPTLPAVPASMGSCMLSNEPCYLFTAGTGVHTKNAVLSCQTPLAATSLKTKVTYPNATATATQWLQATAVVSPTSLLNVIFM